MRPLTPWAWVIWTTAAILGLLGVGLLVRALLLDRSRGRRRCPHCWYDMSGMPDLTCPECGRSAKREKRLHHTRRRWGWACIAAVLVAAALALWETPVILRDGWYRHAPTTVLIAIAIHNVYRPPDPDAALSMRLEEGRVWHWQKRWLARGYTAQLKAATTAGEKQELMSRLVRIGVDAAPAVPIVMRLLNDPEEFTANVAWVTLARIGSRDREALARINALLTDAASAVGCRQAVVNRLGNSGADAAGAVGALILIIERPELHSERGGIIIGSAAHTLGRIGPAAAAALPTLRKLSEDRSTSIDHQYESRMAISLITREVPTELAFHLQMLKIPEGQFRVIAISRLEDVSEEGVGAIPALLDVMGDEDPAMRERAQSALRVILNDDKRARRALEGIVRRADSPVRERAERVLTAGPLSRFFGSVAAPPPTPSPVTAPK